MRIFQLLVISILALGAFLLASRGQDGEKAYALPEYSNRTGEPCAACHVNPGGGGPRTLRGLLWAARGRPEAVPQLPGLLIAPGVMDGMELYEVACAGCHGYKGEGLFAMSLAGTKISPPAIRSYILNGIPAKGMPGFAGQFDEQQLQALVDYLAGLASGEIPVPEDQSPLPPAQLRCDASFQTDCEGG